MEIMKPIASSDIPAADEDFVYEVKYDGFRAILHWEMDSVKLISRNNNDLSRNFPEIIEFCKAYLPQVRSYLPLKLDGELVVLNNSFQANFPWIQKRGRLKNVDTIKKAANARPASFSAFDLLVLRGVDFSQKGYEMRKKELVMFYEAVLFDETFPSRIGVINEFKNPQELAEIVFNYKAEGMIAKRISSKYLDGKKHHDWFKIKNWRTIHGFLTFFHEKNGYFTVGVFKNEQIRVIGKCKHGLEEETYDTLRKLFISKGKKQPDGYMLPPAISVAIHTLDLHTNELREPNFVSLLPATLPEECTFEKMKIDLAMLPSIVEITNTDKLFWPRPGLTKGDLLVYLREISPYMLPFLKDRVLTLIRCPDGVAEESFFQKSLPSYAPSFIKRLQADDKDMMICDRLDSLIWFANHGAVEFHIPFQTIHLNSYPAEIAFDLDPPDRERFDLAIHASLLIKRLIENLGLVSFVKTSGNKGMQIHIPIPLKSMTYDQTALFTKAIASTICKEYPTLFTIERLKKNRHDRLYIDYVQHGRDKTLIAPYSPRKTADATVAAPLFWEEVKEGLTPDAFTIVNMVERVQKLGCPFANFFAVGERQNVDKVLQLIEG